VEVVPGTGNRQFDIRFPAFGTTGIYAMNIGPFIFDEAGTPMDQIQDGIPGSADDYYIAGIFMFGPKILSTQPSRFASPPLERVRVTFNVPMRPETFTPDDVFFFGPLGQIAIADVVVVPGTADSVFDVVLAEPQTALGDYTLFTGTDIYDTFNNPLDQNENLIAGENPEDAFTVTFAVQDIRILEDFESGSLSQYVVVGGGMPSAQVIAAAAHDGALGLRDFTGGDWIYRADAGAQVAQGDIISAWIRMPTAPDARAYFGFGASSTGTMSLVLAPNTGDFRLQYNPGYDFVELDFVPQTYSPNTWYRIEVDWRVGGLMIGRLFASDGTTLLNTVMSTHTAITSGGIAFRPSAATSTGTR
jgi:hypothetical protein